MKARVTKQNGYWHITKNGSVVVINKCLKQAYSHYIKNNFVRIG